MKRTIPLLAAAFAFAFVLAPRAASQPVAPTLSAAESISPGLTNNTGQRANIACFSGTATANHVVADVFDELNVKLQSIPIDLAGNAWRQLPVSAFVEGGYVRFHPTAPAYC